MRVAPTGLLGLHFHCETKDSDYLGGVSGGLSGAPRLRQWGRDGPKYRGRSPFPWVEVRFIRPLILRSTGSRDHPHGRSIAVAVLVFRRKDDATIYFFALGSRHLRRTSVRESEERLGLNQLIPEHLPDS